MINYFLEILKRHKSGESLGIYSCCSAHPAVLEASVRQALTDESHILIEATSNQVNQFGGYTGMKPIDFREAVWQIADQAGLPRDRIILGGDHLGPNAWQGEPAKKAMALSHTLIHDYVAAGYTKIHLDASMHLADDDHSVPLPKIISANRAADLCLVAEQTYQEQRGNAIAPCYVIGTEVPIPGGFHGSEEAIAVTTIQDAEETISLTRQAFSERGLESVWERVIAVVVQPGVEFGDDSLFEYQREAAAELSSFIEPYDHLVYEAHSTDYQSRESLREMVEDHFAILKVGPALTFAYREAIFALAMIEDDLFGRYRQDLSGIRTALDEAMLADDRYWQKYYAGDEIDQAFARKYSFCDRSRYYWPAETVRNALTILMRNLSVKPIPLTLISQYLPIQYRRIREGMIAPSPQALIRDKIGEVLRDYAAACGMR